MIGSLTQTGFKKGKKLTQIKFVVTNTGKFIKTNKNKLVVAKKIGE